MEKDYLIVGGGIAGSVLSEILFQKDFSLDLVDNHHHNCATIVAAGMINPMVFRRMITSWRAKELMETAIPFYKALEKALIRPFLKEIKLAKIINDENELKLWKEGCYKEETANFLNEKFISPLFEDKLSFSGEIGEVKNVYQLNTNEFLDAIFKKFESKKSLIKERFNYSDLIVQSDHVEWKGKLYRHVIFCEGMGIKENPYFNYLPFKPTKGELIRIKADVDFKHTVKKNIFIHPEGNQEYSVGATYEWKELDNVPSIKGREELISKLNKIARFDYQIIDHIAGVRPTVTDRRPYLGSHPKHKNLHVFNGLGTRGVVMAPLLAIELIDFIENKKPLHREACIKRIS